MSTKALLWDSNTNSISNVTSFYMPSLRSNVTSVTTNYSANSNDDVVIISNTSSTIITLPDATGSGKVYTVKQNNVGSVVIQGNGSSTVDGATITLVSNGDAVQLLDAYSDQYLSIANNHTGLSTYRIRVTDADTGMPIDIQVLGVTI